MHDLPHADDALRGEAGRRRRRSVRAPSARSRASSRDRLADDGVSCSVCHQITEQNLGKRESFVGGFKIDETTPPGERHVYGPFEIDKGHTTIMKSSSSFQPKESKHIRSSELCATCHTLLTQALDAQGKVIGELPEQVPYQEWLHSDYKETRSCQSCHMPVVKEEVPITSVFGEPRAGFSRHTFVGGNFFMQRILNRFRDDLSVAAPAAGNGCRGEPDDCAPAIGGGQGRGAERGRPQRPPRRRRFRSRTWAATSCRPRIRRAARGCT